MLIVDDDETLAHAVRDFFAARTFNVDVANELEEAQALLECRAYDVVICDISLMGSHSLEGLGVISELRCNAPDTKIIVLTGCGLYEVEERARELAIDSYLKKPTPLPALSTEIERRLAGA